MPKKYIEREAAIKEMSHMMRECFPEAVEELDAVITTLKEIPAADVVEVVRCRDCKFTERDGTDDPAIYCKKWDRWEMPPNAYCWLGKRKDGGQEHG